MLGRHCLVSINTRRQSHKSQRMRGTRRLRPLVGVSGWGVKCPSESRACAERELERHRQRLGRGARVCPVEMKSRALGSGCCPLSPPSQRLRAGGSELPFF